MSYPDQLIRGIFNKSFLDDDGSPAAHLFYFEDSVASQKRQDGYVEQSINWHDDDLALTHILQLKKESGELQFKAGAAVLSRSELDRVRRKPPAEGKLDYERNEVPGNKYHGNLLLGRDVSARVMKKIAATIAVICVVGVETSQETETTS